MACQSKSSGLESEDVDVDDAGGSTTAVGTMDAPRTARREPRTAVVGAARRIDLFPESATTTRASIRRVTPTRDAEADAPRRVTRTGVAVTRAMAGDESIGVFEWSRRERKCRDNWINGDVSARGPWRVSTRAEKDTVKKETVEQPLSIILHSRLLDQFIP